MERKRSDHKSSRGRKRKDRILHDADRPRSPRRKPNKLDDTLKDIIKQWNLYENTFITKCGDNGFVLKLKTIAHDEEPHTEVLRQHGDRVSLIGVYGKAAKFSRERLLGYILLYVGTPIIHLHTWFVAICYSDEEDIRRKEPGLIATDDNVRLFKTGIGECDYLFCYKGKTKEHDEAGFSDGATHLETAGQWKDGL